MSQVSVRNGSLTMDLGPPAPHHDYTTRARSALQEHPCREAVTQPFFLNPSHEDNVCYICRLSALGLPEFSRLLQRISKCTDNMILFLHKETGKKQ